MSSGLILILAILVLGGVIATIGDRIGTRVGKARLSLFNMRPRRTATLITILTGTVVAASTLGILLGFSGPLRTGIFELESIQRRLRKTRGDLDTAREQLDAVNNQKRQIETELSKARSQRQTAEQQLQETNQSLQGAIAERNKATSSRLQTQAELERNQRQLATVSDQVLRFRSDIEQLKAERLRVIAEGEEEIKAKNAVIREREERLKSLEAQQDYLVQEIARLEREAEGLRRGNVAVQRGQVLASAVVRIVDPAMSQVAVDQLLREANRNAIQLARPGTQEQQQIIQITKAEVEQLVRQIDNGQDYLVRISAAANYLIGEAPIQVFAEAIPNQVVFQPGDVVAATSLNPATMSDAQIQQRINLLLAAAGFRAQRLGIVADTVQIGRVQNLIAFIEKIREYNQMIELRAVAAEKTFTSGPLKVEFVAADNGKVLLRSQDRSQPQN
ncbi:DUF3084 domain-containing protein [Leptodesmis sichuanensis]|uniref:DUF3084 domain-containing protein n=1 Tax=Leptodesmis sichuanensis TaxID=2906798 RepID=UPI001F2D653B|nr:DUF3084 domain-containing protein [Leptodesmis sichuanensis]UIE39137.1 DUF3084 domain-containing protein [Leptodesmis sichuanensis A121]